MKSIKVITILFVVLSVMLTGCKSTQPKTTDSSGNSAYPVEEAYPVYAIDATQLTEVPAWTLTTYLVNNQDTAYGSKTFTFLADGAYTITTDGIKEEGHWYINTISSPMLVLITGAEQDLSYEIVTLTTDSMILKTTQDGATIEEQYQPAN
ncbi:MAG: hypothetical protein H0S79_14865 [Anaerolineaceae bacterium]|nr:hypothetical protein [Anaerolineaceae bacterium]